jgi:hypothetical protein
MSKFVVVLAALLTAVPALSASAANSHPTMHKPAAKHVSKCTGEFMYTDPKTHKCTDARVTL